MEFKKEDILLYRVLHANYIYLIHNTDIASVLIFRLRAGGI
jgi:hypothetical protein